MSLYQHSTTIGDATGFRIAGSKRKRANAESVEEDIAWTAARCQRLLRSVNSRLSSLRKLLNTNSNSDKSSISAKAVSKQTRAPRRPEHWSSVDPVWVPTGKPKNQGWTYTAKLKDTSRKALKARDPNLAFPSPFIKRIGSTGTLQEEQVLHPPALLPEKKTRRSRQLPIKAQSAQEEAENGLESAVSHLLNVTKAVQQIRVGSRSLLSTCLRHIPGYVDLLVEEEDDVSHQDGILTEVFTYLEDLGPREGWPGLREAVRHQCVHLITEAISDNMLSEKSMCKLIDICSAQSALSEGQDILQAWLKRTDDPSTQSVERLESFSSRHRCQEFMFRMINELGKSQTSGLIRFGSSPNFWKDVLSSLTNTCCHQTTQCLVSCVAIFGDMESSGELKAGIRSHMRDFALKLTVMATASVLADEPLPGATALCDALLTVAARMSLDYAKSLRGQGSQALQLSEVETMFVLGSQLLLSLGSDKSLARRVFSLDTLTSMLSTGGSHAKGQRRRSDMRMRMRQEDFASEITKGIVTLEKFVGVTVTGRLLDRSLDAIEDGSLAAPLLKQVALETTSVLRQADDAPVHLDLEQYLKRLNQSTKPASTTHTPHQSNKMGNFRWEEGLCEWVTATPFIGREAAEEEGEEILDPVDDGEEFPSSAECSPDVLALSPPLKRRRLQAKSPLWSKKVTKGVVKIPNLQVERRGPKKPNVELEDESGDELCF